MQAFRVVALTSALVGAAVRRQVGDHFRRWDDELVPALVGALTSNGEAGEHLVFHLGRPLLSSRFSASSNVSNDLAVVLDCLGLPLLATTVDLRALIAEDLRGETPVLLAKESSDRLVAV